MSVKTRIIKIGNSQGIRIPKVLLEQAGLGEEVELDVSNHQILIRAVGKPRQGWDEAFRAMAEAGDDRLLDEDLTVAERIILAQDIWDSLAVEQESVAVTQAQRDELDRRLAILDASAVFGTSWEDLKARLRTGQ